MSQSADRENDVDQFKHEVESLLNLLVQAGNLILAGLLAIEVWSRGQLAAMGLAPAMQTVLMVALAAVLLIAALRLFGGLIRVAVVLVMILVVLHVLLPVLQT